MLDIAVEIHNWESEHFPEMETMSGRFIFLSLVTYFCKDQDKNSDALPLKSIYRTDNISEKSIRNKLKDFKAQGLVKFVSLEKDGRSKCAIPTNQLIKRLIEYAEQINYIIKNHFYLVSIQDREQEKERSELFSKHDDLLTHKLKNYIHQDLANREIHPGRELNPAEKNTRLTFEI